MLNHNSSQQRATRNDENRGYLTLMLNLEFKHHQIFVRNGLFLKVETFPFQKIQRNLLANKTQVTPLRAPDLCLQLGVADKQRSTMSDQ